MLRLDVLGQRGRLAAGSGDEDRAGEILRRCFEIMPFVGA